jgi:hypothetical protein
MKHALLSLSISLAALAPALPLRLLDNFGLGAAKADGQAPGGRSERNRFTLGILRRDGIVIPFAAYDGKRWDTPWPVNTRFLEVPINLESISRGWWGHVEPPRTLTVWTGGESRGELSLGNPTFVQTSCGKRIGLRTNYKPLLPAPPPFESPYPKDGLVISGSQRIDAVQSVSRDAPEWRVAAVSLLEDVDREEQIAATAFTNWRHPIRRDQRKRVPLELEALYRAPMDEPGWMAYYVEAIKRYPPGPDDGDCGLITFARGWLGVSTDDRRAVNIFAEISYCDRKGAAFMLPLGLVRVGGATHWVYQISGYERETYIVSTPTPKGITHQAGYSAGFCSQ